MGVYVVGTLFRHLIFTITASFASMDILDIRALAMACVWVVVP